MSATGDPPEHPELVLGSALPAGELLGPLELRKRLEARASSRGPEAEPGAKRAQLSGELSGELSEALRRVLERHAEDQRAAAKRRGCTRRQKRRNFAEVGPG
jgi:hypothetical protein